jgi:NADPH:quinone reductase
MRQPKTLRQRLGAALEKMIPYFESGEFRPLPVTASYPLIEGALAYQAVADHIAGRVVIHP